MRRVGSLTLISLAAIVAMSAGATAEAKTKVLCWNKSYPPPVGDGNAQVRVKPSKCSFFKRGEASDAGAVHVVSLNWKRWGNRKAKGEGVTVANMGVRADVAVRLSKPVRNCAGKRIFSKVTFKSGRFGSSDFKLYSCPNQKMNRHIPGTTGRSDKPGPSLATTTMQVEAKPRPVVACWTYLPGLGGEVRPKVSPKACLLSPSAAADSFAEVAAVRSLSWKHWGAP